MQIKKTTLYPNLEQGSPASTCMVERLVWELVYSNLGQPRPRGLFEQMQYPTHSQVFGSSLLTK